MNEHGKKGGGEWNRKRRKKTELGHLGERERETGSKFLVLIALGGRKGGWILHYVVGRESTERERGRERDIWEDRRAFSASN